MKSRLIGLGACIALFSVAQVVTLAHAGPPIKNPNVPLPVVKGATPPITQLPPPPPPQNSKSSDLGHKK